MTASTNTSTAASTTPCLEVATFRARAGVARADLLRALAAAEPWLAVQPGFVSRRLLHDEAQDTWVDVIEWRSAAEAHQAMDASATAPFAAAFGDVIDLETSRCLHAAPVTPAPGA